MLKGKISVGVQQTRYVLRMALLWYIVNDALIIALFRDTLNYCKRPRVRSPVRDILSLRLGHENISTAILPLPLIQEEQLSVTGERMCIKYW